MAKNYTSKPTEKNKGGRPSKNIDWKLADKLAALHCTGEEMASVLGVCYDTLEKKVKGLGHASFSDYYAEKSASGKISIRRKQFEIAMSGNVTMLIWLGKQMLNQTEKTKVDTTSSDGSMSQKGTPEEYAKKVAEATREILEMYRRKDYDDEDEEG